MCSTAGHRQQRWTKHSPQQVAKNQPTEAKLGREKKKTLLSYQTWKFSLKKEIKYSGIAIYRFWRGRRKQTMNAEKRSIQIRGAFKF